ncbi:cyclin-domain-containing protein [Microthyrium microscopicum]|uniref:Cyclin-domain-containing protein n=1 Tax=Microthyrium microscopicum TaxID=703497 RepID=A0A6A6ULP0_9PEZI|nr:cyclin-domain-containing protein [Microthyrium microscopicum]
MASDIVQQGAHGHMPTSFSSKYSFANHSALPDSNPPKSPNQPAAMPSETPPSRPPAAPSPSQDAGLVPDITLAAKNTERIRSPPLDPQAWEVDTLEPEVAMKMLARCVQAISRITGDVPPTPPIAITPRTLTSEMVKESLRGHRRTFSRPGTPMAHEDIKKPGFENLTVGAPEAEADEPSTADVTATSEPPQLQQLTIARKFFCKKPPALGLEAYLTRLHKFCPMSTAVYLAAGGYIHKLCIEEKLVPATNRTVHRLLLGSLRIAMKALEDLRYSQERFAVVGGVKQSELATLEVSLCYLLNFDLQANSATLMRRMNGLLQAAQLPGGFGMETMKLTLPVLTPKG